jgi:hypothetical protein
MGLLVPGDSGDCVYRRFVWTALLLSRVSSLRYDTRFCRHSDRRCHWLLFWRRTAPINRPRGQERRCWRVKRTVKLYAIFYSFRWGVRYKATPFAGVQVAVADSSSRNAVSFSSACTIKRPAPSRCASAIQIVRPRESIAETQPQLQPALLRLSAMISQYFISVERGSFP